MGFTQIPSSTGAERHSDSLEGLVAKQIHIKKVFRLVAIPPLERYTWSPDSRYLLAREAKGTTSNLGLWVVEVPSGRTRKLVNGRTGGVAWSPDGKSVAYVNLGGVMSTFEV
jgi:dipeptidyl aminopeptidase/acylaminoacyl peptidase